MILILIILSKLQWRLQKGLARFDRSPDSDLS